MEHRVFFWSKNMKVVSWNINGVRASVKKGLIDYIEQENPDVLCLQEVRAELDTIEDVFHYPDDYYGYFFPCAVKKGYSGVGILTKQKPIEVRYGFGDPKFDNEGRVIQIDLPDLTIMSIYFPNGGTGDHRVQYKLEFYDALFDYCEQLRKTKKNLLISGDYNTAHKEIDLARPKQNIETSGFMPIEREKIDKIIDLGYVDTFREFSKEGDQYTWWSVQQRARPNNVGWRIDYHMVTHELLPAVKKSYHQDQQEGSDHCPVVIELGV